MRTTLLALGAAAAAVGFHALAAQDPSRDQSQDIAWMNKQQAYLTGLTAEGGGMSCPAGCAGGVDYAGSERKPASRTG